MFDIFMDYVKKLFKSRIFPITLVYLAIFCIIIRQLFVIQIVQGRQLAQENESKETQTRDIESTRGNIYDSTGKLLASNALTYSIVMTDSTKIQSDEQRNEIINKMIKIIESNGDTLDTEFFIAKNNGKFEFTADEKALTRFKKNVYAYVNGKNKNLTEEETKATAKDVYNFLRTGEPYTKTTKMFQISSAYSDEETLKIMGVRYALFCNYPKYLQITVASDVNDKTIAAIEENSAELPGVEVKQQTHRVYADSVYFSNIIGYTGLISTDELDKYNKKEKVYDATDIVGKTGIEYEAEEQLRGKKGSEIVSVNSGGKVKDVIDHIDPTAGNDIYLTINSDLQVSTYHLLEKELASILLQKINSGMNYGSKGKSATDIMIPIYEVYNALINNSIIDISHFQAADATDLEKQTYDKYKIELSNVFDKLDTLLSIDNTTVNSQAGDMKDYLNYFYKALINNGILISKDIPSNDAAYADYINDKISLSHFLKYALANNWVDLSKLETGDNYFSSDEYYKKLIAYTKNILKSDAKFEKMIYRNLIFSHKLTGNEICLLLFDQGVLKYNKDEVAGLKAGNISSYNFMIDKIKKLEITPAMLALDPCTGSVVITDVTTGDVLALVSYPGYDNNKFSGKIDSKYFNKVNTDLSEPLRNKPTAVKTAPGSTFKMVTSVAALQEGVVTPFDKIYDDREFTKIVPSPKCNAYPSSHGDVDLANALSVSCNYYFFEMGWRLSLSGSGKYISDFGLKRLQKYASLFGLNKTSGIELPEAEPQISDWDAVRSAIGQGHNLYTPVQLSRYVTTIANRGTCYNLTLLDKETSNNGTLVKKYSASVDHTLKNISTTTWDAVYNGMFDVVNAANGSVTSIFKGLGVTAAGKTGTSQINADTPNNALFVSFAPYNNPKISVTAVIPKGYTSHNAAALAKNIYALYFNLEDKKTLLESEISASGNSTNGAIE